MTHIKKNTSTLLVLILVTFIDFMGMGLIYPIFSKVLFDTSIPFFSQGTSNEIRSIWLGILISLMPLAQFFSLPIWGTISDKKGRKRPLMQSLSFTVFGHLISIFGILLSNLSVLVISRVILGIGAGNISIVQASISDISTDKQKAKNFGLYAMAIGAGFTFGPFIGGALSIFSYSFPFVFASTLTFINLILAAFLYKETLQKFFDKTVSFLVGIKNLKKAITLKTVSTFFLCSFLANLGWVFFMDFSPVYLIQTYNFSAADIGLFYGALGGFFALSSGLLIRPFLSRFKHETLFWISSTIVAFIILPFPFYPNVYWLIPFILVFGFFASFFAPTITTIVSNKVSSDIQGETLGILGSVNTSAYGLGAVFAGFFIGLNPKLSMYIGGSIIFLSSLIILLTFNKKLFTE